MRGMRRLWVALLLGLLVVVTVVGVALAGSKSAPAAQSVLAVRTKSISASDCYPQEDGELYDNQGGYLGGDSGGGRQWFICPVDFDDYGTHTINSITLYCYDEHPTSGDQYDVVAMAYRITPATGVKRQMGTVRSTGSSTTDPRAFTISGTQIRPDKVSAAQTMYFWVSFEGHPFLALEGFKIRYAVS